MRHEHHRDQSCLLTSQIYRISQRKHWEGIKVKEGWGTVPNMAKHLMSFVL